MSGSAGRRGGDKATRRPAAPRGKAVAGALPWWRRPLAVLAILLALFVGLPLAQALIGDLGALMLGCVAAGFALGRATA